MNKQNITIIIAVALIIVLAGYIATDKINFCETARNDSYTLGFNQGIEQWKIKH